MHKADKIKLLSLLGISLILFLSGCVDTSVQPIPSSINYRSQVNFVNLVDGGGAATLKMVDHSGVTSYSGNLNIAEESSFKEVQAGNKTLNVSFAAAPSQNFKFALATDYKYRVFIAGSDSSNNVYRMTERYIWQTKDSKNGEAIFPKDTGWVSFFNGSPDITIDKIDITGPNNNTITQALSLGGGVGYVKLKAGDYNFAVNYSYTFTSPDTSYNTTATMTFSQTLSSQGKYTTAFYGSAPNLKQKVFTDD